jgi:hypothetical protein
MSTGKRIDASKQQSAISRQQTVDRRHAARNNFADPRWVGDSFEVCMLPEINRFFHAFSVKRIVGIHPGVARKAAASPDKSSIEKWCQFIAEQSGDRSPHSKERSVFKSEPVRAKGIVDQIEKGAAY